MVRLFASVSIVTATALAAHFLVVLRPQILDLRRKAADPKFARTAHLEKLLYSLNRLQREAVRLRGAMLLLGALGLTLCLLKKN